MFCLHEDCCLSLFCKDREFYFSGKECVCVSFFLLNVFKRCRKRQSTFLRSFFLNFDGQNVERMKSKHLMMIDNNKDLFWPIISCTLSVSLSLYDEKINQQKGWNVYFKLNHIYLWPLLWHSCYKLNLAAWVWIPHQFFAKQASYRFHKQHLKSKKL